MAELNRIACCFGLLLEVLGCRLSSGVNASSTSSYLSSSSPNNRHPLVVHCQCSRAPTRPERGRPLLVSSMSIIVSVSVYVPDAISLSSIRMFSPIVVPVFAPSGMNTRTVQRYYRETVLTHNEPQITARPVPLIKVRCKMCLRGRRILS